MRGESVDFGGTEVDTHLTLSFMAQPINLDNFPQVSIHPGARALLDKPVVAVWVACHPDQERSLYDDVVNHWRIYLSTSLGTYPGNDPGESVLLDMLKRYGVGPILDTEGELCVQPKAYFTSWNVTQTIACAVPEGRSITVRRFLETIIEQRLHRYRLTPEGHGCRFWVGRAIDVWETQELLVEGAVGRVNAVLPFLWAKVPNGGGVTKQPKAIVEGTFL